jgi:phosphoribosyl 1,2-cyclic phosphodiesterase
LDVSAFRPGERLRIGDLEVKSFHVNHFAADPVAFSIMSGSRRVSVASDLGCVIPSVVREMKGADLLMLEANYDDKMLTTGSYPEFLKEAIRSDHGHLSNQDAGSLVANAVSANTEGVVLIHLSKENNTPARARATVERRFAAGKPRPWLEVAQHGKMLGPISLR